MNDVNNAHKVKRGVVCILASLGIGMVIFGALGGAAYVFAIPPLSPYDPNETLDPTCAPGDTNCTVVTPVAGTGALGQIGFFSGTSTIASDSKFTFSSSTGDLGLVSDSAQFKLGALSDVGITRSVAGTLKITDGSTGLGSIHIGGITFGTASGLLKATAGVVSTATTSDADFILPAQTGNSGKYLTTNGATSSWAVVPSSQWTTSGSDIYYNSGNVGIGTIAPSSKLHVLGGARIEGDANNTTLAGYFSSSTINIYNGNTTNSNYASIGFSSYFERVGVMNTNGYPAAGMGAQFLSHVSASSFNFPTDLYFWTGYSPIGDAFGTPSSEKMRITAAGNVGIGTSTPRGLLEVASSTSKTTLFTVLPNGNVGIGTTSPVYLFDLNSSSATYARFKSATAGDGAIIFGGSTSKASLTAVPSSGTGYAALQFYTSNTPTLHMDTSGYIGIATTTTSGALFTLGAATTTTITDLLINPSAKNAGNLIDAQVGGVSKFSVSNTGVLTTAAAIVSGTLYNYNIGGGGNTTLNLQNGSMVNGSTTAVSAAGGTFSQTSGSNVAFRINPTYNQSSGTAANTDFLINRTETAVGSGAQYLIDAQVGGVSKFNVSNLGVARLDRSLNLATTIDISGYAGWINMGNGNKIAWSSTSAYGGALDTGLSRYNAGTLAVGNGTASDYSGSLLTGRISIATTTTSTAVLTIGAATTTTLTDLLINPAAKNGGNLIDTQIAGVSKFSVTNTGSLTAVAVSASSGFFGTATTLNANYLRNGVSNSRTGDGYLLAITGAAARVNTSGNQQFFAILPSYNQTSGTASNTDLFINRTETAVGSGAQYLIDAQVGSVSKFNVTNLGRGYFADGVSIATSSTSYGVIVGDGSTQKDVYIPKGGLCVDDDNAGCASTPTAGTIYAKATAITGIDVAEHYPTNDVSLESGDVVSFSTQNSTSIEKATALSTQYLAGVISTEPGVLLGKNIENARPVALNGRVPVKVSNENGAINIGDYLTVSSQPGVAAKATSPGMTIGMALEAYNQSGVGKITVFVHTGFALGSSEAASSGEGGLITLLTRTFASIGITIENGITSIKQLIVDKITTKELCVEDLCLNKEQLKFILDRNGITIGSPIPPQESLPPAQTPPVTASSTEEATPTETPVKTPIETPVPTQAPPEPTASDTPPSPEPSTSPSEQTQSPIETATPETPSQ